MATPRPHVKTRSGCVPCKHRKIKCDESLPSCRNCERRKLTCSFLRHIPLSLRHSRLPYFKPPTISPPRSTLLNFPLQFNTHDLELLHFYTTKTSPEMLGPNMTGTDIWSTSIVTVSFAYPFLLYGLFSLSALHLVHLYSITNPPLAQKYNNLASLYHMRCISSFRIEVQDINARNSDACSACAALLAAHSWWTPGGRGADLFFPTTGVVPWYKLHRGGAEVMISALKWVSKGALKEMIQPLLVLNPMFPIPTTPLTLIEPAGDVERLDNIAESWNSSDLDIDDKTTLEKTLQTLRFVFNFTSHISSKSGVHTRDSISTCVATLSWTTLVPMRFCEMVEERCPQALILVAVYSMLLHRIRKFWWIEGKGQDLFQTVERDLNAEWDKWLDWPKREIHELNM